MTDERLTVARVKTDDWHECAYRDAYRGLLKEHQRYRDLCGRMAERLVHEECHALSEHPRCTCGIAALLAERDKLEGT